MEFDDSFFTNDTAWPPYYFASKEIYYFMGSFLAVVGITGIVGNTLVIVVFTRYRRLKGPFSILIINLACGDLSTSVLHIMVVVSSFRGKWAFGHSGCVLYAFGVGFSGMMSIFTLAAISVERYLVITARPLSSWKMTTVGARKVCFCSWVYCSCLTVPPIFGWSKYTVEGVMTSCSWDYKTRTLDNTLFYIYLLGFGFAIPLFVILYCYVFIITAVLAHGKEMSAVSMTQGGVLKRYRVNVDSRSSAFRTAEIILMLIISFFLAWSPYAFVTLIGHFGPVGWLTPWTCAVPAFCAKASVVCNPIVYGWSHPHFKASLRQLVAAWVTSSPQGSGDGGDDCRKSQPSNHELHYKCFTTKSFVNPQTAVPNCTTVSTDCETKSKPTSKPPARCTGNPIATPFHHVVAVYGDPIVLHNVRECSV